jgi:hypothetical protein
MDTDSPKKLLQRTSELVYEPLITRRRVLRTEIDNIHDLSDDEGGFLDELVSEKDLNARMVLYWEHVDEMPIYLPEKHKTQGSTSSPASGNSKDAMGKTATSAKQAAKLGMQQAVASEAGDIALEALVQAVPALKPFADDGMSRDALKAGAALVLMYIAETLDFDQVDKVNAVGSLVVTVSAQHLTAEKLKKFAPALKKIAALATADMVAATKT